MKGVSDLHAWVVWVLQRGRWCLHCCALVAKDEGVVVVVGAAMMPFLRKTERFASRQSINSTAKNHCGCGSIVGGQGRFLDLMWLWVYVGSLTLILNGSNV